MLLTLQEVTFTWNETSGDGYNIIQVGTHIVKALSDHLCNNPNEFVDILHGN